MSTQTGSISFESTGNFSQVVKQNYATLSQIKGQFAVCSTGASTTEKIATTIPTNADWTLYAGATVTVKFTSANTASVPTLNVNNTGPKEIRDYNANELLKAAREWPAGAAIAFTYDGTYWRIQDSKLMERVHSAETRVDQTATSITSLASMEDNYTKPDGTTAKNNMKSYVDQTAEGITTTISDMNEKIETIANPNLGPFFMWPLTDIYNATTNPNGFWRSTLSNTITKLDDGWAHITLNNASGTSAKYATAHVAKDAVPVTSGTLLVEIANISTDITESTGNALWVNFSKVVDGTQVPQMGSSAAKYFFDNGAYYIAATPTNNENPERWSRSWFGISAGHTAEFDARISFYEGTYDGPYKPYVPISEYVETKSTVNSVKQTADSNSAYISNLTTVLGTNADGTTKSTDIVHKYNELDQTLEGTVSTVGKIQSEIETVANANLSPWFSESIGNIYNGTDNPNGYWRRIATNTSFSVYDMQQKHNGSGGWAHFVGNVTSGNPFVRFEPMPISLKPSTEYTFMLEIDGTFASTLTNVVWKLAESTETDAFDLFSVKAELVSPESVTSGVYYIKTTTRADIANATTLSRAYLQLYGTGTFDVYARISLYEGDYSGPYKPYVDPTLSSRLTNAETMIAQNADSIALSATKEELNNINNNIKSIKSTCGRTLNIEDAANLPLLSLDSVYGECTQSGTPTPDIHIPIKSVSPVGGEKNLLPSILNVSQWTKQSEPSGSNMVISNYNTGIRYTWTGVSGYEIVRVTSAFSVVAGQKYRLRCKYNINKVCNRRNATRPFGLSVRKEISGNEDQTSADFIGVAEFQTAVGTNLTTELIFTAPTNKIYLMLNGGMPVDSVDHSVDVWDIELTTGSLEIVSSTGDIAYLDMTDSSTGKPVELYSLNDTYRDVLIIDSSGHALVEKRTYKLYANQLVASDYGTNPKDGTLGLGLNATGTDSDGINRFNKVQLGGKTAGYPLPICTFLNGTSNASSWTGGAAVLNTIAGTTNSYPHNMYCCVSSSKYANYTAFNTALQNELANEYVIVGLYKDYWYTIDLGYVNLPEVADDTAVHVVAEIQPQICGSWWTKIGEKTGIVHQSSIKENAELHITADGISSEVSKVTSIKYYNSATPSWTLPSIKAYAAEGHSESWNISSATPLTDLRVGDTVYVKGTDSTRNCPVYIKITVTSIDSLSRFIGISHGYEDILPVDTIKSTINQSSDSIKIQAKHIEIDGTATFKNSDNTTTTLGDYLINNYDRAGSAEAVQIKLEQSTNLLLDTDVNSFTKVNGPASRYFSDSGHSTTTSTFVSISDPPEPSLKYAVEVTGPGTVTLTNTPRAVCFYSGYNIPMGDGQQYTMVWWARCISGSALTYSQVGSSPYQMVSGYAELTSKWTMFSSTFFYNSQLMGGTDGCRIYFGAAFPDNTAGKMQLCGFKLLPGNVFAETGSRNLLLDSESMQSWWKDSGCTISNNIATLTGSSSNWSACLATPKFDISTYDGKTAYVYSFDYKSSANCDIGIVIAATNQSVESTSWSRTKYVFWQTTTTLPNTHDRWKRYTAISRTIHPAMLTSSSGDMTSGYIQLYARSDVTIQVRHIQMESGNISSDWKPAPEDHETYVDVAMKGGINLAQTYCLGTVQTTQNVTCTGIGPTTIRLNGTAAANGVPTTLIFRAPKLEPGKYSLWLTETNGGKIWFRLGKSSSNTHVYSTEGNYTRDNPYIFEVNSADMYSFYPVFKSGAVFDNFETSFMLEKGDKPTSWKPAPEDLISKTQRIYYRTTSSTKPSAPSTWVTEAGDKWAANNTTSTNWTTKVTPISNGKEASVTKYLYLWTCEQSVNGAGSLMNSTVLLDDTTTVIDGGNIITGTVTANAIKADSGTFNTANIPNLSAAKITSGDIAADRIKANAVSAINATANKIDAKNINVSAINIGDLSGEIGGRNLATNDPGSEWRSLTLTNGTNQCIALTGNVDLKAIPGIAVGDIVWVSFDIKYSAKLTPSQSTGYPTIQTSININGSSWVGPSWKSNMHNELVAAINDAPNIHRISACFPITAAMLDGTYTGIMAPNVRHDYYTGTVYVRYIKAEIGNKPTDWTPAPEDIDSAIDNASKIASNYIHADSSGIRIASANPSTQKQRIWLTSSRIDFYNASDVSIGAITGNQARFGLQNKARVFIDGDNGITIYDASNKKRTVLDTSGLTIYDASATPVDVANFGTSVGTTGTTAFARIGLSNSTRFEISPTTLSAYTGNTKYFEVSASGLKYGNFIGATTEQLGNKNLIRNGNFVNSTNYWVADGATITVENDSTHGKVLKVVTSSGDYRTYPNTSYMNHGAGTYSINFYAKASAACTLYVCRGGSTNTTNQYHGGTYSLTTSWQNFTGSLTTTDTGSLSFKTTSAATFYLAKVMVVNGSKAVTFEPHPLDIQNDADNAAKTATNYMSYNSTNGLIIAQSSPSTTAYPLVQITPSSGILIKQSATSYSKITSSGMEIYVPVSSTATKVASFGTTATIGQTSTGRVEVTSTGVGLYNKNNKMKVSVGTGNSIFYGGEGTYPYIEVSNSSTGAINIKQSANAYTSITSSGMEIFANIDSVKTSVANFGTTARIGTTNGPAFEINANSLKAYYMNGTTRTKYFEVSKDTIWWGTSSNNIGTMSADHIKGGALTLGGENNVNGILQIKDGSNNIITTLNKDGAEITGKWILHTPTSTADWWVRAKAEAGYFRTTDGNLVGVLTGFTVGSGNKFDVPGFRVSSESYPDQFIHIVPQLAVNATTGSETYKYHAAVVASGPLSIYGGSSLTSPRLELSHDYIRLQFTSGSSIYMNTDGVTISGLKLGTIGIGNGGTGKTSHTINSVIIGGTTATGALQNIATKSGAFYATSANGKPAFGTLPVAQGGTGKTAGTCYMATSLYENTSGKFSGAIPLSETAANFTFIEIYCKDNDGRYCYTKVWSPNGKTVNVTQTLSYESDFYIKSKAYAISGTGMDTAHTGSTYHTGEVNAAWSNSGSKVDNLGVVKVIGYK